MLTTAELAMSTRSPSLLAAIIAACAVSCNCSAANPVSPSGFFTYENDAHFNSDRYYTSGVQFSIKRTADRRGQFARRTTSAMCGWMGCGDATLLTTQYNLGQLIYTPADITRNEPQPLDRPWGGLLYYEQAYAFLSPDQRTLTTLIGQVGVTGRLSLAEPAQKLFHRLLDRPRPEGWDNQVGATLGLLASAERRSAFDAMSGELGHHVRFNTATYWRIAAGNIQTYAAAGMAVVIGKDLPPVSPPPPGIGNKLARDGGNTSCLAPWLQCTAFGSVEGRVVAYNVFLDGRVLRDDPDVKRRKFVHDLVAGTRFDFPDTRTGSHGPWFIQFKITRRSKEFRSSLPVQRHRVAALTIGTEF
jgi:lipid A 3-O-deacylase